MARDGLGWVEGGPVTEAALSDRRPLPPARRRCLRQRSPTRWIEPDRRCRSAGIARSYLSQSSKL
jgi:hypothetical protein